MRWIEKLKTHKPPGNYQIPAELIKAGGGTTCTDIRKLIYSLLNKEELHKQWKELIIVPIDKKGDKRDCRGISFCQLRTKFYPTSCCQG